MLFLSRRRANPLKRLFESSAPSPTTLIDCSGFLRHFQSCSDGFRIVGVEEFIREPIASGPDAPLSRPKEDDMGKYLLAWVLGVPAIVLVVIYIFMH